MYHAWYLSFGSAGSAPAEYNQISKDGDREQRPAPMRPPLVRMSDVRTSIG